MYFINYLHTVNNLSKLIKTSLGKLVNLDNLPQAYREFVRSKRSNTAKSGFSIHFEDDPLGVEIINTGFFDRIFTNIFSTREDERAKFIRNVSEALDYIKKVDPRLAWITETLVTDIILFQSDKFGGGSASHLPGLVCISPKDTWEVKDYAESILHEATHLNLFLGDMIYGLYDVPLKELEKESSRVVSAVRIGELRPLDKALHSAVVAVPLMYMQNKTNESTLVDLFTDSLLDCATGLKDKTHLFTDYGKRVVDQLYEFAVNQDFSLVEKAIGNPVYKEFKVNEPA